MKVERPKVGVGVLIIKGGKILLGERRGAHGHGEYGGPGGHLEHLESFEACALREIAEEIGPDFKVKNLTFLCITNLTKYNSKHYVDIGMVAEWQSGEPKVMEPQKLVSWNWYGFDDLPQPLFGVEPNYMIAYKTDKVYFESDL